MKRLGNQRTFAPARSSARALVPGRETAVALLLLLADREGRIRTGEAARLLRAARSSLHRICCILAGEQLLDLSLRGWIVLGSVAAALGVRRDEMLRSEDERRLAPRRKQLARAPRATATIVRRPTAPRALLMPTVETAGVVAVAKLLARVANTPGRTVAALAAELGLGRSTAFSVAAFLDASGLLERDAGGGLHPGPIAARLLLARYGFGAIAAEAETLLPVLRDDTDASVSLKSAAMDPHSFA